ncbi:hypothetical protein PILCRDRAFT_792847, partial [Piloderma croceum F 1598]
LPSDFAPCIIFVILYDSLLQVLVYRIQDKRSRNTMLIDTLADFSYHFKVVIVSLRAVHSHNSARRIFKSLTTSNHCWDGFYHCSGHD